MTHTLIRTAAGVGAVVAFTVGGGLDAAVATADTGGHRASTNQSRDGGHSRRDGGAHHGARRGARDVLWRDGWREGSRGAGTVTARRLDDDDAVAASDVGDSVDPAARVSNLTVASPLAASSTTDRIADDAGGRTSSGGSSRRSGVVSTTSPFTSPRVTFGDGRSPGLLSGRPEELGALAGAMRPMIRLAPVAPASLLPVAPPPLTPLTPSTLPVPERPPTAWSPNTPVISLWGRVQPGWPAGVVFGIAGLLLTPIGGVWLGRRQARAARVASEMVSH